MYVRGDLNRATAEMYQDLLVKRSFSMNHYFTLEEGIQDIKVGAYAFHIQI